MLSSQSALLFAFLSTICISASTACKFPNVGFVIQIYSAPFYFLASASPAARTVMSTLIYFLFSNINTQSSYLSCSEGQHKRLKHAQEHADVFSTSGRANPCSIPVLRHELLSLHFRVSLASVQKNKN